MPSFKWSAAADAKLMASLMRICDVKPTGEQKDQLAAEFGVIARSITHRITHYRNAGKYGQSVKAAASEKKASQDNDAPSTPKQTKPGRKTNKKKAAAAADEGDEGVNGALTPPPSDRPKRDGGKKRDYAALAGTKDEEADEIESEDGLSKKVKIAVGEDIGEGLRQNQHFEEAMAEMGGEDDFN
ncbi:hypothetical protein LTR86_002751 [Recurvomyces mirabilis]|nr:hypothetical protein LTR86_002751 [Recurvomyces mirabilis]